MTECQVLERLLGELERSEGGAVACDPSRQPTSRGKRGGRRIGGGSRPPEHDPHSVSHAIREHVLRLARLAQMERDLIDGTLRREAPPRPGRTSARLARARRERIEKSPLYRDLDVELIAYLEGCSANHVRDIRRASRVDPSDGRRLAAPLTSCP